jgi:hypothetical protein
VRAWRVTANDSEEFRPTYRGASPHPDELAEVIRALTEAEALIRSKRPEAFHAAGGEGGRDG